MRFRVCADALTGRELEKDRVVLEGGVVESGVAEIARLQAREACAYLRP